MTALGELRNKNLNYQLIFTNAQKRRMYLHAEL